MKTTDGNDGKGPAMPDVQATLTFPNLSTRLAPLMAIKPEARPIIYVTLAGCAFAAQAHEIVACVCLAGLGIVALTTIAIVEIRWAGHDTQTRRARKT